MTRLLPCIGAALLALAIAAREEAPARPVERRKSEPPPAAAAALQEPERLDFRTDLEAILGHNELRRALDLTAEHLGLDGAREVEFRRFATRAVEDIRLAWDLREAAPGSGESQAAYEEAKERALEPLLSFLLGTAPDVFLARIEEWIDAVR